MSIEFNTAYRVYKNLLQNHQKIISKNLGQNVIIMPTSKKICKRNSISREAANSLNTAEYLEKIYYLLKQKGYNIPDICIDEFQLPRKLNTLSFQTGDWNVYGPGRLEIFSPYLIFHEEGHFLHTKNLKYGQSFFSVLHRIRNIFKPLFTKQEKCLLINDYKRAYEEGFFEWIEHEKYTKYSDKKNFADFIKTPEKYLSKNALSSAEEFVADYFSLATCGFKFSAQIALKYKELHGPDIKTIITKNEINDLLQYRKNLEKRLSVDMQ